MAAETAKKIMAYAHNGIVHFHNERDQAAAARRPKNFLLYLYTTAYGLKGIVENDELWATSACYLNDSTEIMSRSCMEIRSFYWLRDVLAADLPLSDRT